MAHPTRPLHLVPALLFAGLVGCGGTSASSLGDGLRVERARMSTAGDGGRAIQVTMVHVDPQVFEVDLLTAQEHGAKRTPETWAEEFGLSAVINASMYLPNLRSAGFMVDGERVNNGLDNESYGGFLAFDPRRADRPAVVLTGRDCDGFDLAELRREYRVVLQSYRLLDCGGGPIVWSDPKLYSPAAIAVDRAGGLVLIHGEPCRMTEFSAWLAERPDLAGAIFVEGGPQAGLYVSASGQVIREIGTYEGVPATRQFRAVPNVVGVRARP